MKKNIRLLVFDWDGTRADAEAMIVDVMQSAIRQLQYYSRSNVQIRDVIGLGLVETAQTLFSDMERHDHELIANCYRPHYARLARATRLFPDVSGTLGTLLQRRYHMALATGESRNGLDSSLQQTGLDGFFHASRCADETCSKPPDAPREPL